nr:hypothetical protein [Tanacetum cinerariifolium]
DGPIRAGQGAVFHRLRDRGICRRAGVGPVLARSPRRVRAVDSGCKAGKALKVGLAFDGLSDVRTVAAWRLKRHVP